MQNLNAEKYLNVSSPNMSLEEERKLFTIIKENSFTESEKEDAIEKICRSHIRFISQMANYYCKKCPVDMEDMIGMGVIGMMKAIEKFELEKNCKFTTYCGWSIKLEMISYIQKNCQVKIPQSIHDGLIKIQTAIREADTEMTRESLKAKLGFTEEKMKRLEEANVNMVSLQSQQKGSDEALFLEDIVADNNPTSSDAYEMNDLLNYLKEIVEELDEKTREIVMSKYLEEKVCLRYLADKYGVSQERIRQIQVETTKTLRKKLLEKSGDSA